MIVVVAQAEEPVVIPEGIRYKTASDGVNEKAKQVIYKLFSAKATDQVVLSSLHSKFLICGPGLWVNIENDKNLSQVDTGNVNFEIPVLNSDGQVTRVDKLQGKVFQSPDEVLLFWKAFSHGTRVSEFKIRKLNTEELQIYWAMIPFDITEPIFILESKEHKILTAFGSSGDLKVMWIDDYKNLSLHEGQQ